MTRTATPYSNEPLHTTLRTTDASHVMSQETVATALHIVPRSRVRSRGRDRRGPWAHWSEGNDRVSPTVAMTWVFSQALRDSETEQHTVRFLYACRWQAVNMAVCG
jgi:hypothetical protein